jgi:hypothetical protein
MHSRGPVLTTLYLTTICAALVLAAMAYTFAQITKPAEAPPAPVHTSTR